MSATPHGRLNVQLAVPGLRRPQQPPEPPAAALPMYVEARALGAGRVRRGGKRSRRRREGTRSPRHTRCFRRTESDARRRPAPRPPGPSPRPAPGSRSTSCPSAAPSRAALRFVHGFSLGGGASAAACRRRSSGSGSRRPPHSAASFPPGEPGSLRRAPSAGPSRPSAPQAGRSAGAADTCAADMPYRPPRAALGGRRRGAEAGRPSLLPRPPALRPVSRGSPVSSGGPTAGDRGGGRREERERPLAASRRLGGRRPPRRRGELTRAAPRPGLCGGGTRRADGRGSAGRRCAQREERRPRGLRFILGRGPASKTALKAALDGTRVSALLESGWSGSWLSYATTQSARRAP